MHFYLLLLFNLTAALAIAAIIPSFPGIVIITVAKTGENKKKSEERCGKSFVLSSFFAAAPTELG